MSSHNFFSKLMTDEVLSSKWFAGKNFSRKRRDSFSLSLETEILSYIASIDIFYIFTIHDDVTVANTRQW